MSSTFGKNIKISIFGQSHSAGIGVSIDGLPAGEKIDMEALQHFMDRRAPGRNDYSTARKEADAPEILSGLAGPERDTTCGAPLAAVIRNTNQRSEDYKNIRDIPRPSHADYAARVKYRGYEDTSGGGHFSGRLTAPLCIAGGICLQILERRGIRIAARILQIGKVADEKPGACDADGLGRSDVTGMEERIIERLKGKDFPVINDAKGLEMKEEIARAKAEGDSVGGIIECILCGVPAGIGDPMFDGIENRISSIVFGIPAIKGIEFGAGFAAASMRGSEHNDPFRIKDGNVVTTKNDHGGILGGISSGMPIVFRVAVKPTPSIARVQDSISMSQHADAELGIKGRHDPCIVPRAVPCVEAAAAVALMDMLMDAQ